ncbi:MAG: 3-dehydroquinate synthase [Spirochaetes bacterium]|nr:3-dehydroquinate synthase [Spirochaetota bacterium]
MAEHRERVTARAGGVDYDILIGRGALDALGDVPGARGADGIAAMVSGEVMRLHGGYIAQRLGDFGRCEMLPLEDGEEHKSFREAGRFLDLLLRKGFSRSSMVLAIGGGVAGDFAGFVASVYMRGIPFVQVPTTLLSMVDASIGGKVAVNLRAGKNIVGSFHQPLAVIADTLFLDTLPDRQMLNGLAEIVKHGIIGDMETLEILERAPAGALRDPALLDRLIARSALFKSSVVERDERESGLRKILNFGHTVGHAIESSMEYGGMLHGEAVAAGMYIKLEIMRKLSMISGEDHDRIAVIFKRYGLLSGASDIDTEEVIRHMAYDKKNRSGQVLFVLLDGIGRPVTDRPLDGDLLRYGFDRYRSSIMDGAGAG